MLVKYIIIPTVNTKNMIQKDHQKLIDKLNGIPNNI